MRTRAFWSHTFFPGLIKQEGVVIDLGVNYGGFSGAVANLCNQIIGFEANPYWTERNRIPLPTWVTVIPKAVALKAGTYTFYLDKGGGPGSSLHKGAKDGRATAVVQAITLQDAIDLVPSERIELIKIDIEGEELAILANAPPELLQRAVQITVEFEDFHGERAIQATIARMKALNFWTIKFSWRNYGDVLFVNQTLAPLSLFQRASIIAVNKYGKGVQRVLRRLVLR